MIDPVGLSDLTRGTFARGIFRTLPEPDGPVRPIGGGVSEALTPSHQISSRIEMAIKAASEHTARFDDGLTRLSAGALRFRQGIQIAATTTHFSGAEAHGVTDMGQDLSTQGGPMQLVELVLAQMSELGSGAVVAQAGHLPGI